MTRFQQVVIEVLGEPDVVAYDGDEVWARHLENRLNQAGLKVVEVYENKTSSSLR